MKKVMRGKGLSSVAIYDDEIGYKALYHEGEKEISERRKTVCEAAWKILVEHKDNGISSYNLRAKMGKAGVRVSNGFDYVLDLCGYLVWIDDAGFLHPLRHPCGEYIDCDYNRSFFELNEEKSYICNKIVL